jgi:putative transposase
MPKRTHHAVYDLKYHLVWIPKYRKSLLLGSIEKRVKELFYEIAEEHDFEILAMELMPDHVHLFVSAAPKWSPGKIVSIFKAITSKIIFEEFPQVKKKLWGGEFWEDGYFVRTVGDKITADLIKRYIKYHRDEVHGKQLKLF